MKNTIENLEDIEVTGEMLRASGFKSTYVGHTNLGVAIYDAIQASTQIVLLIAENKRLIAYTDKLRESNTTLCKQVHDMTNLIGCGIEKETNTTSKRNDRILKCLKAFKSGTVSPHGSLWYREAQVLIEELSQPTKE